MPGAGKNFKWKGADNDIVVTVPVLLSGEVPCQHAYVHKIANAE